MPNPRLELNSSMIKQQGVFGDLLAYIDGMNGKRKTDNYKYSIFESRGAHNIGNCCSYTARPHKVEIVKMHGKGEEEEHI